MGSIHEGISPAMKQQIGIFRDSFKIFSTDELPNLPKPWRALSLGGDLSKLMAENTELGIFVKRYAKPEYAALVYKGYEIIKSIVQEANFPLLLPIGLDIDTLVFSRIDVLTDTKNYKKLLELIKLIGNVKLPLSLATNLSEINLKNGEYVFSDPFDDSNAQLELIIAQQ